MSKNPTVIEMVTRTLEHDEGIANKTIADIVEDALECGDFTGLIAPDDGTPEGCGCEITDLMPCNSVVGHCRAGYRVAVPDGSSVDFNVSLDEPETPPDDE